MFNIKLDLTYHQSWFHNIVHFIVTHQFADASDSNEMTVTPVTFQVKFLSPGHAGGSPGRAGPGRSAQCAAQRVTVAA